MQKAQKRIQPFGNHICKSSFTNPRLILIEKKFCKFKIVLTNAVDATAGGDGVGLFAGN